MKRTGFKQKLRKPMKRGTLRKESPQKISVLQRKIWDECKRIVRAKYIKPDGTFECYTCRRTITQMKDAQTGHLWAKASLGAFMKYDLRVLRIQCYLCNIRHGGRGADYYLRMWEENGAEYMEKLKQDRQVSVKAYDHYLSLLEQYKSQ